MSNKTRKHIRLGALALSLAIVGVLAAFVVLAGNPATTAAHGGGAVGSHCEGESDAFKNSHDAVTPADHPKCEDDAAPTREPTDPLANVPAPKYFNLDSLDNGARLSWQALPDSSDYTVKEYQIDREVYHTDPNILALLRNNGGNATIDIDAVKHQHRDLGLSYGTTYTYKVRAYVEVTNADGTKKMGYGKWSRTRTTVTADSGGRLEPLLTPPTAVRMLKTEKACNAITVTWQAPADFGTVPATDDNGEYVGPDYTGGEGAGKEEVGKKATEVTYKVERMVGDGAWSLVAHTGMEYEDSGLTYGPTYKYRVRAMNSHGLYGPWETIAETLTEPAGVLRPENLRATVNDAGHVVLQWTAPVGGNQSWFDGDKVDQTVGNGDKSKRLTYQIERVDASNMDTGFGKVPRPHRYGPRSFAADQPTQEQTFIDENPHNGAATYVVSALVNKCLPSDGTSVTLNTVVTEPGAPGTVEANADRNMITVTWTAPADAGSVGERGATITGYKVERSTTSGSGFTAVDPAHTGTGTSYTDSNLAYETRYYYRVYAVNSFDATSAASAEASDTTAVETLGMASNIRIGLNTGGTIQVTWDPASGAAGYIVIAISKADNSATSAPVNPRADGTLPTTLNLGGLTSGEGYYVYVATTGSGGENTLSDTPFDVTAN